MVETKTADGIDMNKYYAVSDKFASWNRLILRDLNYSTYVPYFKRYSREDIQKYLADPYRYEKQLRDAVIYIYGASPHFRRIIQYFTSLSDLAYIVSPYRIDPKVANVKSVNRNYRKVLNTLSVMNIKTQCPKIITVCLREDVFYGVFWETSDNITIQQLPSDFCTISTIEGNVPNVSFDFSYFDSHQDMLAYYPNEFSVKYDIYKGDRRVRWIDLDAPNSFAVKCNSDILAYAIPPFVGILRELYDLEDYRQLKLDKTALENYAMLAMKLPMDDEGNWQIDYDKAREFWENLDHVLPEEIGSVLTPMDIDKISFEKSNTGDTDTIADCEQNIFTSAGVSSLLFNNEKASATALLLSIKADQAMTYGIVKGIEDAINRFIQSKSYGKNFKISFLNSSQYNSKELGDAYLKAASYGLPTISLYAASQGLSQAELDSMSFLETEVLELHEMFKPLRNSAQMSSDELESEAATDEGGAPTKDVGELSDSREANKEAE